MTSGMPFCSATWAMAVVWPELKAPIRSWAPSPISFLGARTGDIDIGLGIGVHDFQFRQAELLEDAVAIVTPRWQSWPMPAW